MSSLEVFSTNFSQLRFLLNPSHNAQGFVFWASGAPDFAREHNQRPANQGLLHVEIERVPCLAPSADLPCLLPYKIAYFIKYLLYLLTYLHTYLFVYFLTYLLICLPSPYLTHLLQSTKDTHEKQSSCLLVCGSDTEDFWILLQRLDFGLLMEAQDFNGMPQTAVKKARFKTNAFVTKVIFQVTKKN